MFRVSEVSSRFFFSFHRGTFILTKSSFIHTSHFLSATYSVNVSNLEIRPGRIHLHPIDAYLGWGGAGGWAGNDCGMYRSHLSPFAGSLILTSGRLNKSYYASLQAPRGSTRYECQPSTPCQKYKLSGCILGTAAAAAAASARPGREVCFGPWWLQQFLLFSTGLCPCVGHIGFRRGRKA